MIDEIKFSLLYLSCEDVDSDTYRVRYVDVEQECSRYGSVPDWQDFCFNDCANPKYNPANLTLFLEKQSSTFFLSEIGPSLGPLGPSGPYPGDPIFWGPLGPSYRN